MNHDDFTTNLTKKIVYWRLPTTPRNYDCMNIIGCTTEGDYPNIEGKWYASLPFDTENLTKLYEMGNAKLYGYI